MIKQFNFPQFSHLFHSDRQDHSACEMIKSLLTLVAFAQVASATFILLPIYIYPSGSLWAPTYKAIEKYPQIHWQVIVNPHSGPGPANSFPDSDYITAISKLNSYKNVLTLGYVSTSWTNVPIDDVKRDISTYANWASYSAANISMAGIFFDEATTSSSSAALDYMRKISAFAYAEVPSAVTPVIFNPGAVPDSIDYFNYADTVVLFEDYYSNYTGQATINKFPKGYNAQSAIIVHTLTASQTKLNRLVQTIVAKKIGGVYFTNDCCYKGIEYLSKLVSAVAAAQTQA